MDTSKLNPKRISNCAKGRVIEEFFPGFSIDEIINDDGLSNREGSMHSGALCLYAATLLTKVYENALQDIEYDATERISGLLEQMKTKPKFSQYDEDELKAIAREMVEKDIRNAFAHGNFEISYDIYTKKLYYVLQPRRKDFVVEKPIVISKKALFDANRKYVANVGMGFAGLGRAGAEQKFVSDFGNAYKNLLLPVTMLKLSEHYLEKPKKNERPLVLRENQFLSIQYVLNIAKITYEQDDYYKIFGKNSKIFEKIAYLRNAIAHNGYMFTNNGARVCYQDRADNREETVRKTLAYLALANTQKELVMGQIKRGVSSQETINGFANKLNECFDEILAGLDILDAECSQSEQS